MSIPVLEWKIFRSLTVPLSILLLLASQTLAIADQGKSSQCRGDSLPASIPRIAIRNVISGLQNPVHVTHSGDGRGRLFVVEQAGQVRVFLDTKPASKPLLDIRDRVQGDGEMGLLSVAFHPDFARNTRFYVYYISSNRRPLSRCPKGVALCSVVSEFTLKPEMKVEDTERVLLRIPQPYANHNGGQMAFGRDGFLYIGVGDGGGAGDPEGNGQNLRTLLGAVLRINVNGRDPGKEYAIPTDNPAWDAGTKALKEIWAYGFRNPWRFSFDPANGMLLLGDVGQDDREEIDVVVKGGNYGWNHVEGDLCFKNKCTQADYNQPILVLDHGRDGWRSITGGVVYRGSEVPELCGVYLFADYVANEVRGMIYDPEAGKVIEQKVVARVPGVSSFGYGPDGEVYLVSHTKGQVYRVFRH